MPLPPIAIVAVVVVIGIALFGRRILAWDDRRTSDLKGIDFDNAIERVHRLLPPQYKRPASIRILDRGGHHVHVFLNLMAISRYSLANLTDSELQFAIIQNMQLSKLLGRIYLLSFMSFLVWYPLCELLNSQLAKEIRFYGMPSFLTVATVMGVVAYLKPRFILQADLVALKITGDPDSAASAIRKLGSESETEQNLPKVETRLARLSAP